MSLKNLKGISDMTNYSFEQCVEMFIQNQTTVTITLKSGYQFVARIRVMDEKTMLVRSEGVSTIIFVDSIESISKGNTLTKNV